MLPIAAIKIIGILFLFKPPVITGQQIEIKEIGNNRYYFSDSTPYSPQLNWFLAFQYCRSIGMDLLSMPRYEEATELMNYLRNNGKSTSSYWTSGNQLGSEMWIWMNSGHPFNTTFSLWSHGGPPLTKSQNGCLELNNGKWSAENCMRNKPFICNLSRCYYFNYVVTNQRTSINGSNEASVKSTPRINEESKTKRTNENLSIHTRNNNNNRFSNRQNQDQQTTNSALMNKFPGQQTSHSKATNIFQFLSPPLASNNEQPKEMNKFSVENGGAVTIKTSNDNSNFDTSGLGDRERNINHPSEIHSRQPTSNFGQKTKSESRLQPPFLFPDNSQRQNEILPSVVQELVPPIISFREDETVASETQGRQRNGHSFRKALHQFSSGNSRDKKDDIRNLQRRAQFSWALEPPTV